MASLTGSTIAASYEQLLSLPDGGGNTSNLVAVTDGDGGTTFCISLTDASTGKAVLAVDGSHANGTEIQIDNSATDGDAFLSFQLSGTSKFTMGVDDGDSDVFKIGTTAIGSGTMFVLDTSSNISLSNNDSGVSNTIFGKNAGDTDGGGDLNVFIGELAGGSGTQTDNCDGNVGVGYNVLNDLTEGFYNVAIGSGAGATLTTGVRNIAIGYAALDAADGAESDNIAIGSGAMGACDQGSHLSADIDSNVAIGTNALLGGDFSAANTNLTENVAIGYLAMDGTGTIGGNDNVFVGKSAGGGSWATAESNYNVGIGKGALAGALNGQTGSVAVGVTALEVLTTGAANTAVGYQAGNAIETGEENTIVGYQAFDVGVGDGNVAIGKAAMGSMSHATSDKNTAIGTYSLLSTGANESIGQVAVGYSALQNCTSGTGNVAVGYQSGLLVNTGEKNTLIGYQAGYDLEEGDENTYIGYDVDGNSTNAQNRAAIGYGITTQADDSVTLGNNDVTAVYMAQDSGARVYGSGATLGEGTFSSSAETLRLRPISDSGAEDYIIFSEVDDVGDHFHVRYSNDNGVVGSIKTNGSATAFNTSSDYRLKENEVAISDGLTRLNQLKPYRFNFKTDADTTLDGFFAHELAEIVPQAVSGEKDAIDPNGVDIAPQGVDASKLVPLLVAAVQELTAKVEALENA